ncbi:MAG TPA: hypothetical protein VFS76_02605 [Pyrinomonadaceae bacterium]|nr:hypothetical protein [Pyrinomonadaceae bacterium]
MKIYGLLLSLLVIPAFANAQTPTPSATAPDVEVVKFSWSKERLNWETNPFAGPNENFHEMQFRARSEKRVSDAKRSGTSGQQVTAERDAKVDAAIIEAGRQPSGPARYYFIYRASMRNASAKPIAEIDWDYVFVDAATGQELNRHQFTSSKVIAPGKSRELSFSLSVPPTKRISVYALNKQERSGVSDQVVVVRIKYADGSVWQPPQASQ